MLSTWNHRSDDREIDPDHPKWLGGHSVTVLRVDDRTVSIRAHRLSAAVSDANMPPDTTEHLGRSPSFDQGRAGTWSVAGRWCAPSEGEVRTIAAAPW
jgi:hypothetical protein